MSTPTLTRAVAWTGAQTLTVEDRAPSATAAPGTIVVRVESIGVCGTDISVWRGDNARVAAGTVIGHEFGGTIVDVGERVLGWTIGQHVAVDPNIVCGECRECATGSRGRCPQRKLMGIDIDGGLQSHIAIDPARAIDVDGASDPRALALVEPIAVGVHACSRAGVTAGARLGIIGGGAIGMACALQARNLHAGSVTVVEPDEVRRATIAEYGVTAIAPGEAPAERWDVAIDTVGLGSTITAAMDLVEPGSRICVVGLAHGGTMPSAADLVRRELTLTGTFCYTTEDLHVAAGLVARHGLTALPVDIVQGLDSAPAAIEAFAHGHLGRGKTVIIP
ncbi:zinc-dependent alcohol dehydrogenase [Arthrobacter sp. 35W]|uniref:zinc-dependent alcohol dehydrogenase n=1 Tax=Arthrobacter sp. 35W TaxID=1132441 RepID=UPI00041B40D0|nr:alcohol dehydrogenase catalytic domain-containing protein [Arthrobacter sp. 35W]